MQTTMTTTIQTVQPPTSMTMMTTTVIDRTAVASTPTVMTMIMAAVTMIAASMPEVNAAIVTIMTVPTDEALALGEALVRSGTVGQSVVPTGVEVTSAVHDVVAVTFSAEGNFSVAGTFSARAVRESVASVPIEDAAALAVHAAIDRNACRQAVLVADLKVSDDHSLAHLISGSRADSGAAQKIAAAQVRA